MADALDIVKDLLARNETGTLDLKTLRNARPAIDEVVGRLERLKKVCPAAAAGVGLGDGVRLLVESARTRRTSWWDDLLSRVAAL